MLYTDVIEYIEKRIEKEHLKSGCKLPSVRCISDELKCSKETVLHAYHSLFKTNEISFFYCIPRNHNPLGTNLTNEQKQGIVKLANKYNVYVIEDDYLADMNGEKNDLPMHYYDTEGKVIYVKSFAKAFLPGIRLGIEVLPKDCCESFYLVKRTMDLNTSQLDQAALEVFIKSGMYEKHIQKMRNVYSKKVTYLKQFLHSLEKPNIQVIVDESGYFIWIGLNSLTTEEKLVERLRKKGILVAEGKSFYYMKQTEENGIRLCIAKYETDAVCRGLQSIFNEIGK